MRALFVTVQSSELYMPVEAWLHNMGPAAHITYNVLGPPNDEGIKACAKGYEPDFIFYIGANTGILPELVTFRYLRDIAPVIHYQSDVEDEVWHGLLKQYRDGECFDLIVSQCGVNTDLVDIATLMAIDTEAFAGAQNKYMLASFSGSVTPDYDPATTARDERAHILWEIGEDILRIRRRRPLDDYRAHVKHMKRAIYSVNCSLTGSGRNRHVKWRVLESAFADCALLEDLLSPTVDWFPKDTFYRYGNGTEARRIIQRTPPDEASEVARRFAAYAREHYTPKQIYNDIVGQL